MTSFNLAVLISGRGSNLEAILTACESGILPAQVRVVLSDNPEAKGLEIAKDRGVPSVVVERNKAQQSIEEFHLSLVAALKPYDPDLVVMAGYMRVLGKSFLQEFPNRVINIHPSLLPQFRGLEAQKQALDGSVCFSGCTVHLVNEQVDAGIILGQAVVPVYGSDTVESLSARILVEEHNLYPAVIKKIVQGEIDLDRAVQGFPPRSVVNNRVLRSYEAY